MRSAGTEVARALLLAVPAIVLRPHRPGGPDPLRAPVQPRTQPLGGRAPRPAPDPLVRLPLTGPHRPSPACHQPPGPDSPAREGGETVRSSLSGRQALLLAVPARGLRPHRPSPDPLER